MLTKFRDSEGRDVWLNPEQVVWARPTWGPAPDGRKLGVWTEVRMTEKARHSIETFIIAEDADYVTRKLIGTGYKS